MDASRNGLLASLPAPDLPLIKPHLKHVPLHPAAVLQGQEASVEHVYFPLSGAVSLLTVMEDGNAVETLIIGREGAIGLGADFGPWIACTRAVVLAHGVAECIPAAALEGVARKSQEIARMLLRYKEALCSQVHQIAACNALHSVEQRVARWLLQASGRSDDGEVLVTQEIISQMLGLRRTTVTIAARRFQRAGLIRHRRGHIAIANRAGLQKLACECYETCRRRLEAALQPLQSRPESADLSGDRQALSGGLAQIP
jgi:CRP-like cAMP-binding protein